MVAAKAVSILLDMVQGVVVEFKSRLITGMMLAPILQMDDATIQKISVSCLYKDGWQSPVQSATGQRKHIGKVALPRCCCQCRNLPVG